MKSFRFFQLLIAFFSFSTLAALNPVPPVEAYGALPDKSMMVMSPSGERIAYRATSADKDIIMVYDLKNQQVLGSTDVSEINPRTIYFVNDDKLIYVASENKRLAGFKGRHNVSAAYSFNLERNKLHKLLSPGNDIYSGQAELGVISGISADGKYAYMPAWTTANSYSLMKVSLDRPRKPRVFFKGGTDIVDFFMGSNDKLIAKERYNNETNIHRIDAYIDGNWVEVFKEKTDYITKSFTGLTPDEKHLVMIAREGNKQHKAYFTLSLQDGTISGPIFNHDDKGIEHVITDRDRIVHGVRYSGFKPSYEFFDSGLTNTFKRITESAPYNTFTLSSYTKDWKQLMFFVEGDGSSGEFRLFKDNKFMLMAKARQSIGPAQVHQINQISIKARDGLKIPTLLTLPKVKEMKKLPAVILPHGGPEAYDRIGFDWLAQYFASRGYLVIQPQFRGSKGFGVEHLLKGRGEWGRKMQDDLTDTVNKLVQSDIVNPNKVCIVGASYGGYAALAGAAFTPDLYQCAVSINGVSDVDRMVTKDKINYGSDHWVVSYWEDVISKDNVADDHLEQISPINHIEQIKIPVLLIHGNRDKVVPYAQSDLFADEMKDHNKQVEYLILQDGNHSLSSQTNRTIALKAIDKFIQANIGS